MYRRYFTALILCAAIAFPMHSTAQNSADYIMHTVEKGQGLYSIARIYGVTEAEIIAANPGSENVIKAGEQLRIPKNAAGPSSGPSTYLVKAGDTLYSLSKQYGITVSELLSANPGLAENGLKAGQEVVIPAAGKSGQNSDTSSQTQPGTDDSDKFMTTHVVAKKETIYKISRKYGISQTEFLEANPQFRYEKLKIGNVVNIPYPKNEIPVAKDKGRKKKQNDSTSSDIALPVITDTVAETTFVTDTPAATMAESGEEPTDTSAYSKKPGVISAALMMPFELDGPQNANQRKMVEFYQGVLLAVNELKKDGRSLDLHVYDTGSENSSVSPILSKPEMKYMDIIFGPKYEGHISEAASFARENGIPIVLPVHSSDEDLISNSYVYQLNTPSATMYSQSCRFLLKQFRNPKLIVIGTKGEEESPMVIHLKREMERTGNPCVIFDVNPDNADIASKLADTLSADRQNIFVLSNSDGSLLSSVLPILQLVTRMKDAAVETHLFGYPEYQYYAYDHMDELFEVDTWFYSWFFMNNRQTETMAFDANFRQAYNRQMMQSYPNYAAYGYDMALYFLNGISRYGKNLGGHTGSISTRPVQMGFNFTRNGFDGGYINQNVFMIHLSNQYQIEKLTIE